MLNIKGKLHDMSRPMVMGIVNVTPDSFYDGGRYTSRETVRERLHTVLSEGADIVDVGACSTRPGAEQVSEDEEWRRLSVFFDVQQAEFPEAVVSVDTYRSGIARRCVEECGAAIINDISGGGIDPEMFPTAADLHVPYVLSHIQGIPENMQNNPHYDNLIQDICSFFSSKIAYLHQLGMHDIILDPGFGFGKTLEHNYQLMAQLDKLQIFDLPILVGISRKSMIYNLLGVKPTDSLNGTTVLNTIALLNGAGIIRVHDVREAVDCVRIVEKIKEKTKDI